MKTVGVLYNPEAHYAVLNKTFEIYFKIMKKLLITNHEKQPSFNLMFFMLEQNIRVYDITYSSIYYNMVVTFISKQVYLAAF